MKKIITVFGSSLPQDGDAEYENAQQLGAELAKNGFGVCSGGYQGIMDAVSKGATENGGKAYGVTVNSWNSTLSTYLTEEITCNSLFERITKLVEMGDAYIILQGGTGTLLELSVIWEYTNKKLMQKKPILCHSKMWKDIAEIMDKQLKHEKRDTGLVKCCDTIEEIVDALKIELKD